MQAGRFSITATQGKTFNFSFTVKTNGTAWNLTGYTARMQVRKSAVSTGTVLNLVSPTNITLNSEGKVAVSVNATTMAGIAFGEYVYDIELESSNGTVYPTLEGKFLLRQEVTR
jgi:hypothetical protein